MTTLEQELNKLKALDQERTKQLDKVIELVIKSTTFEEIDRRIQSVMLQHKDALTLKEVSERLSIPISTIYRFVENGKLRVRKGDGIKKIVLKEDYLDFFDFLKQRY